MVETSGSYVISNDAQFARALRDAAKRVDNLSFAYKEISRDWRKSNKAQFSLQGSGQYPPLSPRYKQEKAKRYPRASILVATGRLRDSVTKASHKDHINLIKKSGLILGTKTPYGIYHQSDRPRRKIPQRKFLFIGPEAPRSAPSPITGRLERWLKILDAEVQRQLDK